jgi:spore coat polysaccharide biosynthesis predicted glycosyltransferase SpsG
MNFKKNGVDNEQIFITNNQYFEKFIPYKKKMNKKFKKCLILDYEIYSDDPFFKVSDIYNYRDVALSVAKSLKTKVVCIKSREEYNLNYEKKINYKKDEIPIYYRGEGYSFTDLVKKVDFVIGPPGSAMIEALLSNVPFFPVEINKLRYKKLLSEKQVLFEFIYYSKSKKDLKYNIENKKFLKKNFSVEDFSDLNKLKNKDLYALMEKAVYRVIND